MSSSPAPSDRDEDVAARTYWRWGLFPLPLGYVWNGAWHGFRKRSKDGDVWCVQLWHPTRRNLLLFSQRPWVKVV